MVPLMDPLVHWEVPVSDMKDSVEDIKNKVIAHDQHKELNDSGESIRDGVRVCVHEFELPVSEVSINVERDSACDGIV